MTPRRGPRPAAALAVVAGLVLLLGGCTGPGAEGDGRAARGEVRTTTDDGSTTRPPTPQDDRDPAPVPAGGADGTVESMALIAEAVVGEVTVHVAPGEEVTHAFTHPTAVGAPLTFLVDEVADGWLRVLLPVRPNGSQGWIRTEDVTLARTPFRLEVSLGAFELTVHEGDEVRLVAPIGLGTDQTPTPHGRYFVTELLQPPDPDGPYGPYAFGLSGFSEVHRDFAGGQGVIGVHGTDDPGSIGRRASNGCIRVHNEVVAELATFLPLGTPVEILP
jgi:lipoprotein-anchoring transpeptidase ErfK/SrfK